jgi:transcriptional antiterminator
VSLSIGDAIKELPPSAKLVFVVLEHEGPLTQQEITEKSRLSARTARYALNQLNDLNVISEDIYFPDARQQLYELTIDNPRKSSR